MLRREDTVVVVIDFQEKLTPRIAGLGPLLEQAVRLIRFARELELPVLVTEQYPRGLGPTIPEVAEALGKTAPMAKTAFGCLGDGAFAEALAGTGRRQLLITGVETHVCVMQTALQALEQGYEVFVAQDAVGSRSPTETVAGLARMTRAGAEPVTVEMALFELLREAGTPEFRRVLPLLK